MKSCFLKMTIIKTFDKADELLTVTLNCHVNKKLDDSINQRHHNHHLEFLNDIKTNFVLKFIVDKKIAKNYASTAMN